MGNFNEKYNAVSCWHSNSNKMRYNNCILKANIVQASSKALEIVLLRKSFIIMGFNHIEAALTD